MKILSATVDWHEDYDNPPSLKVEVDSLPSHGADSLLRYRRSGRYYWASTEDGYVTFLYDDPYNHAGYGGSTFTLAMVDGSTVTLVGPWSGNEVGAAAAGAPASKHVIAHVAGQSQYCLMGANITVPIWRAAIAQFCPDAEVHEVVSSTPWSPEMSSEQNRAIGVGLSGGPTTVLYELVRKGMSCDQTYAFKRARRYARFVAEVREERYPSKWGPSKLESQMGIARHVNELIEQHDLQAFGLRLLDLEHLPPLLPPLNGATTSP